MKRIFLIVAFLVVQITMNAQSLPDAPCGPFSDPADCPTPDAPPEDEIPVDGGVGLLFAAGAVWGIKKLKEKN